MMEEEFDIQQILDAGHLIVNCLPAFFGFPRVFGGRFVTLREKVLKTDYTAICSTVVKLFLPRQRTERGFICVLPDCCLYVNQLHSVMI